MEIREKKSDFCRVACAVSSLDHRKCVRKHKNCWEFVWHILQLIDRQHAAVPWNWQRSHSLPLPASFWLLKSDISVVMCCSSLFKISSSRRRGWHMHIIKNYDRFNIVVAFLGYWNGERMHFNLFSGRSKTRRNFRFTGLMRKNRETSFRNVSISPELIFPISACSDSISQSQKMSRNRW